MEPLPTLGERSTADLLQAYQKVMMQLVVLEDFLNSSTDLNASVSTWRLLQDLKKAVCQIPFHPRDYAPESASDPSDPSAKVAIRENFERARELRFNYLEKNLLWIDDDASGECNQKESREKIELMKAYVQRHIDHLER